MSYALLQTRGSVLFELQCCSSSCPRVHNTYYCKFIHLTGVVGHVIVDMSSPSCDLERDSSESSRYAPSGAELSIAACMLLSTRLAQQVGAHVNVSLA